MIALVDIGNSRTKYVVVINGVWQKSVVINNNDISEFWLDNQFTYVTKIIIASVAGTALLARVHQWCDSNKITYQQVFSEKNRFGLTSAYHQPEQLGVDRWLGMLGAITLYPQKNVLIIDAGTATTFDLLDENGQHHGGWILAGINALFNSITVTTEQVQAERHSKANLAFGYNSSENVNNACWAATIGAINVAIRQSNQHLASLEHIIITGGNATEIARLLDEKITVNENLVFTGLAKYL